ncbi:MAG: DUF3574 domain-containing protein [Xanthobacteraceae bacterium]
MRRERDLDACSEPAQGGHGKVPGTLIAAAALLLLSSAAAYAQSFECRGGQKAQQVAELTFGRRIVGHIAVSESQWMQFLDNEITPRFPDGLTVYDAAGQWRDSSTKKIVRELSKTVLIVLPGNADDVARLNEIVETYKRRYRQQSVGIIVRPACVSF